MLSVPTLWTVFVVNFLALGLIWAYVTRSYPAFGAARFWTASAFAAAAGAACAMLRVVMTDSLWPLLVAGTVLVLAACLAAMGINRFYGKPVAWRSTALITGATFVALSVFIFGYDSVPLRMLCYTTAQVLPMALSIRLLLSPENGRVSPGARLAGVVASIIVGIYGIRLVGALL